MRAFVLLAVALLAGCSAPSPGPAHPAAAPAQGPEPGLFVADDDGLHAVPDLPGLTVQAEPGTATYTLDVPSILNANSLEMLLVQALANLTAQVSYDADVAYAPKLAPSSDVGQAEAVCIGTGLLANPNDHGFYLDRALGRPGTPPAPLPDGGIGTGVGHSVAGPTNAVVALYGDRFTSSGQRAIPLRVGEFLRVSDFVSQLSPVEVRQPGNHWTQRWAVDGPVRVIRIPGAPAYCATGFGEFAGAQRVGREPAVTTIGGGLRIPTRYGTSVNLNAYGPGDDPDPANSATVRFGDRTCRAAGGQGVSLRGFEPGEVEVQVQQWVGTTWVFVAGIGPGQDLLLRDTGDHCPQ